MLNESKRRGDLFVHIFEVLYVLKAQESKSLQFLGGKEPK